MYIELIRLWLKVHRPFFLLSLVPNPKRFKQPAIVYSCNWSYLSLCTVPKVETKLTCINSWSESFRVLLPQGIEVLFIKHKQSCRSHPLNHESSGNMLLKRTSNLKHGCTYNICNSPPWKKDLIWKRHGTTTVFFLLLLRFFFWKPAVFPVVRLRWKSHSK